MLPLINYSQAEAWLLSMTDYERLLGGGAVQYDTSTFDLDNFRAQLTRLGDPHLHFATIHVAGTKGKGSTCAFLESALRHCGYRTGLYTSPHLFRFTERIRVAGEDIPDADFCRLVDKLGRMMVPGCADDADDRTEAQSSFRTVFEILTAAAFEFFAEQGVDVAIIETGLGGRLDSTNMFDKPAAGPLINIITAIGLDHTTLLGNSVAAITAEKAGIIRPHGITIVAPQASDETEAVVRDIVNRRCAEIGAVEPILVKDFCQISRIDNTDNCYSFKSLAENLHSHSELTTALADGLDLCPSLEGAHQAGNVATALTALVQLEEQLSQPRYPRDATPLPWPKLLPTRIKAGLEHTAWQGRFQIFDGTVPVVIDGAHCAMSANALAIACGRRFGARPAVIVTGFLRDKAGTDLLAAIFSQLPVPQAVAVAPPSPRAVSTEHIQNALEQYLEPDLITVANSVKEALALARSIAEKINGYIIIFGSLYLVGPALNELTNSQK